jgi:hypothetical protein
MQEKTATCTKFKNDKVNLVIVNKTLQIASTDGSISTAVLLKNQGELLLHE